MKHQKMLYETNFYLINKNFNFEVPFKKNAIRDIKLNKDYLREKETKIAK